MLKTIWTSVDTLCIGDSILVQGGWEKVLRINSAPVESEEDALVVTDSHTLGVKRGAMVEVAA